MGKGPLNGAEQLLTMPLYEIKGQPKKVVRPGAEGRSRWETNGFASEASPLVNCSNWQDAMRKESNFNYKWQGLIEEIPEEQCKRSGIWFDKTRNDPKSSRSHSVPLSNRSQQFTDTGSPVDPSWDERGIDKIMYNTRHCAKRMAQSRILQQARDTLKPRLVNDSQAYHSPLPGYTGKRPQVRSHYENARKGDVPEIYTVTKKDFTGFDVPGLNVLTFARERDQHVDYRVMCHRYTNDASPYINPLGVEIPKRFNNQMCSSEYVSRTSDEIKRIQARAKG